MANLLTFTEILVANGRVHVFDMPDRRPNSNNAPSSQPVRWVFQSQIEAVLFSNEQSTGALYRLLKRTPEAEGKALCLRHRTNAIADGLVSDGEWEAMVKRLHKGVRSITLVPVEVAVKAAALMGETNETAALIEALGYDRPAAWDEEESSDAEGEGEGEAEGEAEGEEEEGEAAELGGGDEDSDGSGGGYSGGGGEHSAEHSDATEQFEYEASDDEAGGAGGEAPPANDGGEGQSRAKKAAKVTYTLVDVPSALQRELALFTEWRLKPINRNREGVAVEPVTAAGNRGDALRLLGWLKTEKNIKPSLGGVFGSDRLGVAVQAFCDHLRACGRTFTTIAGYVKSFVAVARFVHSVRAARAASERSAAASMVPVEDMQRVHKQVMQQVRLEQKFAKKPDAWLDWSQVQTARARAVREYEHRKDDEGGDARRRLFDATLLTWLTTVPPDRVSVTRKLQLGVTLKPTPTGFDLDLSTPDAHKTAAIFGPSTTRVPNAASALLRAWVAAAGLGAASSSQDGRPRYVFVLGGGRRVGGGGGGGGVDHSQPLRPSRWTELVKGVLARHAGVPLAPKDLRGSFITWLMSAENTDAALRKAVAHAMRHSEKQQASPAYDKEGVERMWAAAVEATGRYAARF